MWISLLLACLPDASVPEAPPAARLGEPTHIRNMRARELIYTKHAKCRMACRKIDALEVEHVLATGRLDPARSRDNGRCPSHALEGKDSTGGPVRIVFAACDDVTKVVTVIDLDDDFRCSCDG